MGRFPDYPEAKLLGKHRVSSRNQSPSISDMGGQSREVSGPNCCRLMGVADAPGLHCRAGGDFPHRPKSGAKLKPRIENSPDTDYTAAVLMATALRARRKPMAHMRESLLWGGPGKFALISNRHSSASST